MKKAFLEQVNRLLGIYLGMQCFLILIVKSKFLFDLIYFSLYVHRYKPNLYTLILIHDFLVKHKNLNCINLTNKNYLNYILFVTKIGRNRNHKTAFSIVILLLIYIFFI